MPEDVPAETGGPAVPRERIAWVEEGTALFGRVLDGLSDADLDAPSALPGWSRRHVVAHVGYNARALSRLITWARTGVETPMYADTAARNAEIEEGARFPTAELRALATESAEQLGADLAGLPADRWGTEVVTAQGRTVPATEVPWMRCREVWTHAVDLGGAAFDDLPADLVDALARDVLAMWTRRGESVGVELDAVDRAPGWPGLPVPGAEEGAPVVCSGSAAALTGRLTGRAPAPATPDGSAAAPALPRWL